MANIEDEVSCNSNYFVCTLGEAAIINSQKPHAYKTINEFLDYQSLKIPDCPAVGFPILSSDHEEWESIVLTFDDLHARSIKAAQNLSNSIKALNGKPSEPIEATIALLCPSSIDFLFTWLGLMRLGFPVLLIAPQCQPSAVAHLCLTCKVSILIYDVDYENLAQASAEAAKPDLELRLLKISDFTESSSNYVFASQGHVDIHESTIAYLHHTSGTSTGLPKPIPQSHHAAVGVLPCLNGYNKATFTTTPLYHGGVADCFRAWTSGALIWLFPGKEVPITAKNVLKSLDCSRRHPEFAPVKYFSSVPYVLQMVAAEDDGMKTLSGMNIVGVGGAALTKEVGDDLVEKGVNLVSRFGSAECGFLLSSHRDYKNDSEWQFLRNRAANLLIFENVEDGVAELVIRRNWPHMAKRNRDDGSFATADLFERHPTISNAWRYHSRADSQLTLATGKKFDPAPLENAIATSPLLSEVLIFGNGQTYPGALLFKSLSSEGMSVGAILHEVWPAIEKLNTEGQGHTRLSNSMLIVMPSEAPGLEKSSKGTILRGQAEERYKSEICRAYERSSVSTDEVENGEDNIAVQDQEVPSKILAIIQSVINSKNPIPEEADLFSLGVDSVACMQIRNLLQRKLLTPNDSKLPLNVVYDCGTIQRLSQYILNIRKGYVNEKQDEIQLMQNLVTEYGTFSQNNETQLETSPTMKEDPSIPDGPLILLTGATGALGAHILSQLLKSTYPSAPSIVCLVRASSLSAALARVNKSLSQRQKALSLTNVTCVPTQLSDPHLGLHDSVYASLVARTCLIIHAAWAVNFSMRLQSFVKDHIAGLRHLIDLALQSPDPDPPRFLFCSSTASVIKTPSLVLEQISHDPTTASPLGYSRSKWVAEAICDCASRSTRMRGQISVLRIGQLCGDTENGIWNVTEAWPLMLRSAKVTHSLPMLKNEKLNWLPVDLAAKAIIEISQFPLKSLEETYKAETPVFHILNPDHTSKWFDLITWTSKLSPGIAIVNPAKWVEQLECLTGEAAKHPARKLLGLWRDSYCPRNEGSDVIDGGNERSVEVRFAMDYTRQVAPVMRDVQPVGEKQFERIWRWVEREMCGGEDI